MNTDKAFAVHKFAYLLDLSRSRLKSDFEYYMNQILIFLSISFYIILVLFNYVREASFYRFKLKQETIQLFGTRIQNLRLAFVINCMCLGPLTRILKCKEGREHSKWCWRQAHVVCAFDLSIRRLKFSRSFDLCHMHMHHIQNTIIFTH